MILDTLHEVYKKEKSVQSCDIIELLYLLINFMTILIFVDTHCYLSFLIIIT
jgi:hypothetical protein